MALKQDAKARRRRLYARQTLIYAILIAVLAVVGVAAAGMYFGRLDRWFNKPYNSPSAAVVQIDAQPCPVGRPLSYPDPASIKINVLNGNGQSGLAAGVASTFRTAGFPEPSAANAKIYDGVVKVVAGVTGINNAYTVLEYLPKDAVLAIDWRTDTSVDVILGTDFEKMPAAVDVGYDPESAITPIDGCRPALELREAVPRTSVTATPTPTPPAATEGTATAGAEGEDETAAG
ncbi:MAG: LytR C-terminal domain-containing protein [Bifidobacteriaceae bacterium]|jgi:hypothetical protein|nr:LytR C-terminal domain-containing protein [Bifidobacteriaceae bacterium]